MQEDSVFTKIIKGEIPCHKVYEDDKTIAFLTIDPLIQGHTLVVPKLQIDDFEKLPKADYQALFTAVRKVAARIKEAYGVRKAIVTIMGYEVPHAHVHIMPAHSEIEFYDAIAVHRTGKTEKPSQEALAGVAKRLQF